MQGEKAFFGKIFFCFGAEWGREAEFVKKTQKNLEKFIIYLLHIGKEYSIIL